MQRTLLSFGCTHTRTNNKPIPECSGHHPNLNSIQKCKKCYTIIALRKRCSNTINALTGQTLGTWGTKEQLLERIVKNSKAPLRQSKKLCDGSFALYSVCAFHFSFVFVFFYIGFAILLEPAVDQDAKLSAGTFAHANMPCI